MEFFNSLDYGDIAVIVVAVLTAVGGFAVTKSRTYSTKVKLDQVIDADVLSQFAALFQRVADLETRLSATRNDLAATIEQLTKTAKQLDEMKKLEEYLQFQLTQKETEVSVMKQTEASQVRRIQALEDKLRVMKRRISELEKKTP